MNNTDRVFYEHQDAICLLHLATHGKLSSNSTIKDSQKYFWKIKENCQNCVCKDDCLCMLYTKKVKL